MDLPIDTRAGPDHAPSPLAGSDIAKARAVFNLGLMRDFCNLAGAHAKIGKMIDRGQGCQEGRCRETKTGANRESAFRDDPCINPG
jgi:hypothetical protein